MSWGKKLAVFFTLMVCAIATSCAGGDGNDSTSGQGAALRGSAWSREGWGFSLEDPGLSGDASALRTVFLTKDRIYYSVMEDEGQRSFYFEENGSRTKLPLRPVGDGESYAVLHFLAGKDGSLFLIYRPTEDTAGTSCRLSKYTEGGEEQYHVELMEIPGFPEGGSVDAAALDGDGHLYLSSGRECFLFDENGSLKGSIQLDSMIQALGEDAEGAVYACTVSPGSDRESLVALDFEKCKAGKSYGDLPCEGICLIGPGASRGLVLSDGASLYEYIPEEEKGALVTSMEECGIYDETLYRFAAFDDESFFLFLTGKTGYKKLAYHELKDDGQGETEAAKEKLVLGVINVTDQVRSDVGYFNSLNTDYEIELREYGGGDLETDDAVARLNADILSGNGPDLLNLSDPGLMVENYVKKGILEDLTPFLEGSSALSRDDLQEGVLEACTMDGRLVGIPGGYYFHVMMGLASVVGDRDSFSVKELISLLEEHPDKKAIPYVLGTPAELLRWLFRYNADFFLDYEGGTCSFDSQDFRDLVYLTELLCRDVPEGDPDGSLADGGVLLQAFTAMEFTDGYSVLENFYGLAQEAGQGQEVSFIGYPTVDGSRGIFLSTGELAVYGILSGGQKKDGAWEFIESSLEHFHARAATYTAIPVQKADLEADIARLLDLSYEKDGEGNILTDENGSPVRQASGRHNGISQYYPEEKDAQDYRWILKNMRMIPIDRYNPVCTILYEEMQAYFDGQKTLDEAIDILQSRAGLYMGEIQ